MSQNELVTPRVLTVPNLVSLIRLLLVPVFGWLIATGHDGWAVVVLAVSGASDWLDGVLARRLHQVSRLGQPLVHAGPFGLVHARALANLAEAQVHL